MADDLKAEAISQWQLGDWHTLMLQSDDEWLRLGARLVRNRMTQDDWEAFTEANPEQQAQLLTSVAYNGLGRSALLLGQPSKAQEHFEKSLATGPHSGAAKMLAPLRMLQQASDLDVKLDPNALLLHQSKPSKPRIDRSAQIQTLYGFLDQLLTQLASKGKSFTLDGMKVFNGKDPFMAGKTVLALAYWVSEYPNQDRITIERIQQARTIIHYLGGLKSKSWGAFFYLQGLQMLNKVNLLEDCFSVEQLEELKEQLHWNDFIDKHTLVLKNKPTNFYQVGFAIAQLRFQLGWDSADASYQLLDKMQRHVEEISGEYGFADETNGKGRYDRYSFLLIAEVAHRMREAGLPLPEKMKKWLRNSVDYVLINLNTEGDGFQYGRSIGAYGDTAFLEILSAAAWYGLLSQEELVMSYHFCCLSTDKFIRYWWDEKRGSVNLWEDGRIADGYRGKHRILGENFSLIHQHSYTHTLWKDLGVDKTLINHNEFLIMLNKLPKAKLTFFNSLKKSMFQQAVFTWRDKEKVFNLPLVNGDEYSLQSAYMPMPIARGVFEIKADTEDNILVPYVKTKSGQNLYPFSFYRSISLEKGENSFKLSWESRLVNARNQISIKNIIVKSDVIISSKKIVRNDIFTGDISEFDSVEIDWKGSPAIKSVKNSCVKLKNNIDILLDNYVFDLSQNFRASYKIDSNDCREVQVYWEVNF